MPARGSLGPQRANAQRYAHPSRRCREAVKAKFPDRSGGPRLFLSKKSEDPCSPCMNIRTDMRANLERTRPPSTSNAGVESTEHRNAWPSHVGSDGWGQLTTRKRSPTETVHRTGLNHSGGSLIVDGERLLGPWQREVPKGLGARRRAAQCPLALQDHGLSVYFVQLVGPGHFEPTHAQLRRQPWPCVDSCIPCDAASTRRDVIATSKPKD